MLFRGCGSESLPRPDGQDLSRPGSPAQGPLNTANVGFTDSGWQPQGRIERG